MNEAEEAQRRQIQAEKTPCDLQGLVRKGVAFAVLCLHKMGRDTKDQLTLIGGPSEPQVQADRMKQNTSQDSKGKEKSLGSFRKVTQCKVCLVYWSCETF